MCGRFRDQGKLFSYLRPRAGFRPSIRCDGCDSWFGTFSAAEPEPRPAVCAWVGADFLLNLIGYNLIRIPKLVSA